MNFLGMGPGELLLIAGLGLIVFGPGKLPEIAGQVGRAVRDFRRSTTEISSEFQRSFSLEEPPAAPSPVGPAAVFAQNGASAPGASQEGSPAAAPSSEPQLVDTTEWHWERGESEQHVRGASSGETNDASKESSFWQWNTAGQEASSGHRASESPAPVATSTWQWQGATPESPSDSPVGEEEHRASAGQT